MIARRAFLALLSGTAAAWPVQAQQAERARPIGILMGIESGPDARKRLAAFRQGLQALGWIEGRNSRLEVVWGASDAENVARDADDLLRRSPEVVLANGPVPTTVLQKMTRVVPIVFVQVPDPVELKVVASIPRPGGNITGFSHFELSFGGKWLEALQEIAPDARRVAVMSLSGHPAMPGFLRVITEAASLLQIAVTPAGVRTAADIERSIGELAHAPAAGLILLPSPIAPIHADLILSLTSRYRIPAIYPFRYFVESGGLMSYGIDTTDLWRRAANYVDRILKGTKPADLPVQAPTKFELVVNRKTAGSLGLALPTSILLRANEVIE